MQISCATVAVILFSSHDIALSQHQGVLQCRSMIYMFLFKVHIWDSTNNSAINKISSAVSAGLARFRFDKQFVIADASMPHLPSPIIRQLAEAATIHAYEIPLQRRLSSMSCAQENFVSALETAVCAVVILHDCTMAPTTSSGTRTLPWTLGSRFGPSTKLFEILLQLCHVCACSLDFVCNFLLVRPQTNDRTCNIIICLSRLCMALLQLEHTTFRGIR